jgi:hypothetical protein
MVKRDGDICVPSEVLGIFRHKFIYLATEKIEIKLSNIDMYLGLSQKSGQVSGSLVGRIYS